MYFFSPAARYQELFYRIFAFQMPKIERKFILRMMVPPYAARKTKNVLISLVPQSLVSKNQTHFRSTNDSAAIYRSQNEKYIILSAPLDSRILKRNCLLLMNELIVF